VLGAAWRLGMLGTLLTALIGGVAAPRCPVRPAAAVTGSCSRSILASTDTAAVFGRAARNSALEAPANGRTLEGEAGLNDPVAVLLVVGFISWIQDPAYGAGDMAVLFVQAS
jgi:cell volume regulation protein A